MREQTMTYLNEEKTLELISGSKSESVECMTPLLIKARKGY
jgi:hypothetical protein